MHLPKMMSVCQISFFFLLCLSQTYAYQKNFRVAMPGVIPTEDDNYLCYSFSVTDLVGNNLDPIFINKFQADSDANKAHHIILQSCKNVGEMGKRREPWDCRHHQTCEEGEEILFAWARSAPPTEMPEGVTFKVDPNETPFLVLQVHYVHPLNEKDSSAIDVEYQTQPSRYTAGIYLMMRTRLTIPGRNAVTHGDMNCIVRSEMHPFAFRTHAHKWGTVITGYKYDTRTNEMIEFARGNPQWPQAFYPVSSNLTLYPGDFFVGRCTYNTTDNPSNTYIGSTAGDEMCNLYIMYYGDSARFDQCFDEQSPAISAKMPLDSDVPPPRNEMLEEIAAGRRKGDFHFMHPTDTNESGIKKKGSLENADPNEQLEDLKIAMPGAHPDQEDNYLCTSFESWNLTQGREMFIRSFKADATAMKAHHIILQKCDNPPQPPGKIWNCIHHSTCNGESKIMFAWAKDAPPTYLPDNVGFKIGESSKEHLVLQVHYMHPLKQADYTGLTLKVTDKKPAFTAGILLLWSGYLDIPPHKPVIHGDINCKMNNLPAPLYMFAFRTHAHALSTVITGYRYRDGQPIEIARGDPQKPQTFYPMRKVQDVKNGDFISARCTYNTTMRDTPTQIGPTGGDEMCNLYIMYYTKSEENDHMICSGVESQQLVDNLPLNSDTQIKDMNLEMPLSYENNELGSNREGKNMADAGLYTVPNWPPPETLSQIGQPTGITLDTFGNPVIFHRGDRVWDGSTFGSNNVYAGDKKKPIPMNTIITLDKDTGKVLNAWGANMFFLPHMITIDSENNVWMTDVAMHQVFHFPPYGGKDKQPDIVLGRPFEPGSDDHHYCKPTSVAVLKDSRTFFVADGYCNSRIIQYVYEIMPDGHHNVTKLNSWGIANGAGIAFSKSPYSFNVPHGLALAEDKKLICVADRENGRVQCFNIESGKFEKSIQPQEFGSTIYSVDYAKKTGQLYAIGGPETFGMVTGKKTQGYIIDINTGNLLNTFNGADEGFKMPHDVAVQDDGSFVYVVEINPFKVWKLSTGKPSGNNPEPTASGPTSYNQGQSSAADYISKFNLKSLETIVPSTNLGVGIVVASVLATCLISLCCWCRRCRKRGKGKLPKQSKPYKKDNGKLDLGDLLGRSKDGFQPLKTEEDDAVLISSDSDVEDFSVPALHT